MQQGKLKNKLSERELRRAGQRFHAKSSMRLQSQMEMFVKDCVGKSDDEIMRLYKWYEQKWRDYATRENKVRAFTVFGDAFESACRNAHKDVKRIDPATSPIPLDTAIHVFELFRDRGMIERGIDAIKQMFTRKPIIN